MKTLGSFISKKTLDRSSFIDQQTVFYIFARVIKEEYGKQGIEHVTLISFRDKKIMLKISRGIWESELLLRKKQIIALINKELGGEEIIDLTISH